MRLTNERVFELAKSYGFDLVGFAQYKLLQRETDNLRQWLNLGYNSGMKYMENNLDKRRDVKLIHEEAESVISLAMNYYTAEDYENLEGYGKVSRYAWGEDYHLVIWERLADLISDLQKIDPGFKAKSYVDTGPVMDKAWAVRAGIGWLGKHTNVINPEMGSWFFLEDARALVDYSKGEKIVKEIVFGVYAEIM